MRYDGPIRTERINLRSFKVTVMRSSNPWPSTVALICFSTLAVAELQIDSAYPTRGDVGAELELTLQGAGFDYNPELTLSLDASNRRLVKHSLPLPLGADRVSVFGNLAYVTGGGGVSIVDITRVDAPSVLSEISAPGARDLTAAGGLLYILTNAGLVIVDAYFPREVIELGTFALGGGDGARSSAIADDLLYVANRSEGLLVIDVNSPSEPALVNAVPLAGAAIAISIAISENHAYVTTEAGELHVFDLSDPGAPTLLGSQFISGLPARVKIVDGILYVAHIDATTAFDVSNPAEPVQLYRALAYDRAEGIAVDGDRLLVADRFVGLSLFDVSDPAAPTQSGGVDTPGAASDVAVTGGYALLADTSTLEIIDVAAVVPHQAYSILKTPVIAQDINIHEGRALVVDAVELLTVNIDDPFNPVITGRASTFGHGLELHVDGDLGYLADLRQGFLIYDVSGDAPVQLGSLRFNEGSVSAVDARDGFAYLGHEQKLLVVDVADPALPEVVFELSRTAKVIGVKVLGEHLVVAQEDGLFIFSLDNPAEPVPIAHTPAPGNYWDLDVAGQFAFAATYNGVDIFNLADRLSPVVVATIAMPLGEAKYVKVQNQKLLVVDTSLQIFDISLPSSPRLEAQLSTPGYAQGAAMIGDKVYVADGNAGLTILPVPLKLTPTVVSPGEMSVVLPPIELPGHYSISASDGFYEAQLPGAVSFTSGPRSKAIVVAGGGNYTGNHLWGATLNAANFAYKALVHQGFRREDIQYLNPDVTVDVYGDGETHVDAVATRATLQHAIETWARSGPTPAEELILFVVDHGGDARFRLNVSEELGATELDEWLDNLQDEMPGRLVVVYDACQSGTFLPHLTTPPDKQRIVMSSTGDESAIFANGGGLSFSFQFWASVLSGGDLYESFLFGRNMMQKLQTAHIDANGNGVADEKDDKTRATRQTIGRGYIKATDKPFISFTSEDQAISGTDTAAVSASGIIDATGIRRVWGVVLPPNFDRGAADVPILDLPEFELTDPDGDNVWEGSFTNFDVTGIYEVSIFAENTNGAYSVPDDQNDNQVKITQLGSGANQPPTIVLDGRRSMELQLGTDYTEPGYQATDAEDGDLSNEVGTASNVNANAIGSYTVTYSVTDSGGKMTVVERSVFVVANTAPVISLLGRRTLDWALGRPFVDPGVVAEDAEDGDLTAQVVVAGTVNSNVAGSYNLVYSVSDESGRTSAESRSVNVFNDDAPTIALAGALHVDLAPGEIFVDEGVVATDNEDGTLTGNVEVLSTVDLSQPGTYSVVYAVGDSVGHVTLATRTVTVTAGASATPVARLVNLSTRGDVGSGDSVLIGGLIVEGDQSVTVLLRARGPSLGDAGVTGHLLDPTLELFSGQTPLDDNDNWADHARSGEIPAVHAPAYAAEAAMVVDLAPGGYTVIVRGVGGETGIGIVEAFDLTPASGNLAQ